MILPRLRTLDPSISEAALDLGASELRAFWFVTLPLMAPALFSSFLIAFTISFDEFAIASFLAPPGSPTYPVVLYSSSRTPALLPEVIAIGSIVIVLSLALVVLAEVARRTAERRHRGAGRGAAAHRGMRRAAGILALGVSLTAVACGSSSSSSTGAGAINTLPAHAVPGLPSTRSPSPRHFWRARPRPRRCAPSCGAGASSSGARRYFQGESRKLQLVDSRTLRFHGAAGATAFVGFLRTHLNTYVGSFAHTRGYSSGAGRDFSPSRRPAGVTSPTPPTWPRCPPAGR